MLFIDRAWLVRRGVVVATLCLALFTISFLRSPTFQPTAATAWQADRPLTRADSPDDRVALTFDVTWQKQELAKILDILDQAGVKATFFVGGTFLQLYPDMVKEIARRGHEVGTLGQQIRDLSGMPENEIVSNLLGSQSALAKILGGPVRYFRPPSGKAPPEVLRAAHQARLVTVTYALDGQDHLGLTADQIVRRVVRKAQRGDIIRLTASDFVTETAEALPRILEGLQRRGFKLVRISDLVPADDG
ncbi:polysaccharide deacetylase family protein [Symbiobacterium thermophilum]|uniref:polysaccharide deacetylase family protein n=1 Tax=Symbiobacterium thermophilum TaxID=2734 RepID=UPI0035C69824